MIAITRIASIAPGKTGEAVVFGHQVAKYFKDKYATRYDSLAQWEALTAKMLADKEYMGMVSHHAATFLPGSVHDEIWRTV